jgi:RNA polymerase sigma-70 factor (ECF subfamily)
VRDAIGRLPLHPNHSGDRPAPADRDAKETPEIAVLTRKLVAGDELAYRTFFDAYFDRLSRYLLVVTSGNEDAMREALQETFRRVVRHIRVFNDENVFWSWLTVLARSARADESRKRRRYLAFLDRFTQHSLIDSGAPRHDHRAEDLEAVLVRSLSRLPAEDQALLDLKYFEHHSVHEIAATLQTTEKAVESRLARARRKLKDLLLADLKHDSPD